MNWTERHNQWLLHVRSITREHYGQDWEPSQYEEEAQVQVAGWCVYRENCFNAVANYKGVGDQVQFVQAVDDQEILVAMAIATWQALGRPNEGAITNE